MNRSSTENGRQGALLLNFGGPETLADIRPFLYNLFSDPEIIRIKSDVPRKLLAWTISWARLNRSRGLYRQIGGGSPLVRITGDQAAAVRALLASRGHQVGIYIGMRCWKPTIDDAMDRIMKDNIRHLVLLPLFPQYSMTTTGSCFRHIELLNDRFDLSSRMKISRVEHWYDCSLYIQAMTEMVRAALKRFHEGDCRDVHLLYSAHSLPARCIEEGDPYLEQTKKTVMSISSQLNIPNESSLAFQSRAGPVKWLGPDTEDVLTDLAGRGVRRVLIIPVSFVSDHVETLQEIDIRYRKLAEGLGIEEFRRVESLNLQPKFIEALAEIIKNHLAPGA
ncbi:MAG TPA: ferrochelatase [Acidobacteriota bacterium]|nr:ferrochelatase [Acidobacteriota bacterium]